MTQPSPDSHDEGYFASFTDMLVGVIFIFIILLMIVANDFQSATESVIKVTQDLESTKAEVIAQARQEVLNKARNEELSLELDEARKKAFEAEKLEAIAQALAEYKQSEVQKAVITPPTAAQKIKAPVQVNANTEEIKKQQISRRSQYNEARAKIIQKIQTSMNQQGFSVTADPNRGILIISENSLFNGNQGDLNYWGKRSIGSLAKHFDTYLPCIAPTADANRLAACDSLGVEPNEGLDVIYIDAYPGSGGSKEDILLLAVQRVVSVFNELKTTEPYLDRGLKNRSGIPILNIKVNQARRNANQRKNNNTATKNSVVIRLIMRK